MIRADAGNRASTSNRRLERLAQRLAAARASLLHSKARGSRDHWYRPDLLWPHFLKD